MANLTPTQQKLQELTTELGNELIELTPEFLHEIQFEIVATDDGGADIGLLENHPEVQYVKLSPLVYELCGQYLPLVKTFVNWRRSLLTLQEAEGKWKFRMDYEYTS